MANLPTTSLSSTERQEHGHWFPLMCSGNPVHRQMKPFWHLSPQARHKATLEASEVCVVETYQRYSETQTQLNSLTTQQPLQITWQKNRKSLSGYQHYLHQFISFNKLCLGFHYNLYDVKKKSQGKTTHCQDTWPPTKPDMKIIQMLKLSERELKITMLTL